MTLRPEQRQVVDKCKVILAEKSVLYMAFEVRTGKSLMSLTIAHEGVKRQYNKVCFITKKKAIKSVESDYIKSGYHFEKLTVINFEQVDKLLPEYDLVIVDEAHAISAYPRPTKRAKDVKAMIGSADVILMSGTPTPESPSQIYHQLWVSQLSPFANYTTFYKFAKDFVTVTKKYFNGIEFNDYSKANEKKIKELTESYTVHFSQEDAGFTSFVEEIVLVVPMKPEIYKLMNVLKTKKVYKMQDGNTIVADTPVKLQSIFHQISSGTVKIEDKRYILDRSKVDFLREYFIGKKIAIFFKFIEEGNLLKTIFDWTDSPEEFNTTDKTFICQIISGREGTNLSSADALVMYNIDFSATSYWQARARMQTKDRVKDSKIYWLFSDNGIEKDIYKAVNNKKPYTLAYFNKTLKEWSPNYNQKLLVT